MNDVRNNPSAQSCLYVHTISIVFFFELFYIATAIEYTRRRRRRRRRHLSCVFSLTTTSYTIMCVCFYSFFLLRNLLLIRYYLQKRVCLCYLQTNSVIGGLFPRGFICGSTTPTFFTHFRS